MYHLFSQAFDTPEIRLFIVRMGGVLDRLRYLKRLLYKGPLNPNLVTLQGLHLAHLRSVPFENLDIHLGRRISLDLEDLYNKIILARRGGFCYELNGLFGWLLRQIGFEVRYLSARVVRTDPSLKDGTWRFTPEFDHLVLHVFPQDSSSAGTANQDGWLVDVGFGDSFLEPLPIVPGQVRVQKGNSYKLEELEGGFLLLKLNGQGQWQAQYRFTLQERNLIDFESMNNFHQTSPESHFTQHAMATIANDVGRITLADLRLLTTKDGIKMERSISEAGDYASVLIESFGIILSEDDLSRLMARFPRNSNRPSKIDSG